MARGFYIAGEVMVTVQQLVTAAGTVGQGGITSDLNQANGSASQLGLTDDQTRITPRWTHTPIFIDDYGPNVPVELLWMMADVTIDMNLIHVDPRLIDLVIRESMAGGVPSSLASAGTPMHGHYMLLTLQGSGPGLSWTFNSAYLADNPIEIPVGASRSIFRCRWKAIPHKPAATEIVSNGAQLFARF